MSATEGANETVVVSQGMGFPAISCPRRAPTFSGGPRGPTTLRGDWQGAGPLKINGGFPEDWDRKEHCDGVHFCIRCDYVLMDGSTSSFGGGGTSHQALVHRHVHSGSVSLLGRHPSRLSHKSLLSFLGEMEGAWSRGAGEESHFLRVACGFGRQWYSVSLGK